MLYHYLSVYSTFSSVQYIYILKVQYIILYVGEVIGFRLFRATGLAFAILYSKFSSVFGLDFIGYFILSSIIMEPVFGTAHTQDSVEFSWVQLSSVQFSSV